MKNSFERHLIYIKQTALPTLTSLFHPLIFHFLSTELNPNTERKDTSLSYSIGHAFNLISGGISFSSLQSGMISILVGYWIFFPFFHKRVNLGFQTDWDLSTLEVLNFISWLTWQLCKESLWFRVFRFLSVLASF